MRGNTGSGVSADAAYRSEEMGAKLCAQNLNSHIHRKGKRGKALTEQAKGSNRTKSTVQVRVEHVFGAQTTIWAAPWCAPLARFEPRPRSAWRTSPTTCAGSASCVASIQTRREKPSGKGAGHEKPPKNRQRVNRPCATTRQLTVLRRVSGPMPVCTGRSR